MTVLGIAPSTVFHGRDQSQENQNMVPILNLNKSAKLFDELRLINNAIANLMAPFVRVHETIASPFREYAEFLQRLQAPAQKAFSEIGRIVKEFQKLPPIIQKVEILLAQSGWYLDAEIELDKIVRMYGILNQGHLDKIEGYLVKYYRENLKEIETTICQEHPKREKIIKCAFNAHGRKEYELAIPVFLAQADGIFADLMGMKLFKSNGRIKSFLSKYELGGILNAFLSPLFDTFPISASEKKRTDQVNGLNRHQVLHGESTDYGTEMNSLKAISYLTFIANVVPDIKSLKLKTKKK